MNSFLAYALLLVTASYHKEVSARRLQDPSKIPPVPKGTDPFYLCVNKKNRVRGIAESEEDCGSYVGQDEEDSKITAFEIDTSDIPQLLIDVAQLRIDVDSNDVEISQLRTDVDSNDVEISQLRTDVDSNDAEISQLRTDVDSNDVEISQLRTDVDSNDVEISQLRTDLNIDIGHLANLRSEFDDLKALVDLLHPCGLAEPGEFYPDMDNDGYGDSSAASVLCPGSGLVSNRLDCDDTNSSIHPDAIEVCDGVDNNCNGSTDENQGSSSCGTGACFRTDPNCVNGAPNTCTPGNPIPETCNGIDDNCNGVVDEGTKPCANVCSGTVGLCAACPSKRGAFAGCDCNAQCASGIITSPNGACCDGILVPDFCDPFGCIGRRLADGNENARRLADGNETQLKVVEL